MKEKTKIILTTIISVTATLSITAFAVFRANAANISFESNKTDKNNVEESLNELYEEIGKCPKDKACLNKSAETKKCKRATTLHTEICNQIDNSIFCSSTNTKYNGTDINNKDTIIYGNVKITEGELHTGDAFTCDVNGDRYYDEIEERFYYVSDLYTGGITGSETFDSNYAVLLYYNNTTAGISDNTSEGLIAYNSNNVNNLGPITGVSNLPSTTQWSNVNLKTQTRQIRTEAGTTSTTAGSIQSYTYTDKSARLLTTQEIKTFCEVTGGNTNYGEIDTLSCRFLMENTKYSDPSFGTYGYWLETPLNSSAVNAQSVDGRVRGVTTGDSSGVGYNRFFGVRPAIEVLKTDIAY